MTAQDSLLGVSQMAAGVLLAGGDKLALSRTYHRYNMQKAKHADCADSREYEREFVKY